MVKAWVGLLAGVHVEPWEEGNRRLVPRFGRMAEAEGERGGKERVALVFGWGAREASGLGASRAARRDRES